MSDENETVIIHNDEDGSVVIRLARGDSDGIAADADKMMSYPQGSAFHVAVIAGLRERGWPEPREQQPNGEYLVPCWVWGEGRYPVVWLDYTCLVIGYETADDQESAHIEFDEGVSPARVIEAIDRLRWVIGLDVPYPAAWGAFRERIGQPAAAMGVVSPGATIPPEALRRALRNMGVDPDGPPNPKPKPEPKADRPFVPRKIGEF